MPKKFIIVVVIVIVLVAGAAVFFLLQKEAPLVTQAKEGVRRVNETHLAFQNRVNAIPVLEVSKDAENDIRIESSLLEFFGFMVPGVEGPGSPQAEAAVQALMNAQNARGSSRIGRFDPETSFIQTLEGIDAVSEVAAEDLAILERLADTFDAAVAAVRADVPELLPLTVARNEKTEKQFQEFERIRIKHEALASSLEGYSSADFRATVARLQSANTAFRGFPKYVAGLVRGTDGGYYPFSFANVFPEAAVEETAVKDCVANPGKSGCVQKEFMPGHFQELMRILADSYEGLVQ